MLLLATVFSDCTISYIKEDTLKSLQEKYEAVYVCIHDISVGNDEFLKAGTRVRLYFQSGSNSLKVYAYPFETPRERALGKNILYLFDTDFPDNKFMEAVLDKRLNEILKKVQQ